MNEREVQLNGNSRIPTGNFYVETAQVFSGKNEHLAFIAAHAPITMVLLKMVLTNCGIMVDGGLTAADVAIVIQY